MSDDITKELREINRWAGSVDSKLDALPTIQKELRALSGEYLVIKTKCDDRYTECDEKHKVINHHLKKLNHSEKTGLIHFERLSATWKTIMIVFSILVTLIGLTVGIYKAG